MGAGGLTRTQFERREVHQSLVAEGRTAEWLHAHGYTFPDKRMRRSMRDDFRRKLCAFTSLFRCWQINL